MNNKYNNNAKLLTLLAEIINASEDACAVIEESDAYKQRDNEHHADAVRNYNRLISIYVQAVDALSSITS